MSTTTLKKQPLEPFRGMMPIMPTAITETGSLDESSQRRLVKYCLKCGAVAIGHFGFASEFHKISDSERRRLIKLIVEEIGGRVPFFAGVTAMANHIAVDYAKEAQDLGADMLMAAIPYVSVPGADGLYRYYEDISNASTLPIIVQDTALSAAILTPEFIIRLFNEIEQVHYVKSEGSRFLENTARLIALTGGKLPVIGGAGGKHLIHMLRVGVTSFMTGTEMLDLHNAVVEAYLSGDENTAADLYFQKLLPYFIFYNDHSELLLKRMLQLRGVIDCARVIPPAQAAPMGEAETREFEWVLERIGFLESKWPKIG